MAKIVDCSVRDCPTPKIVVPDIPPTPVPKIDIGDLSSLSGEMEAFFKKKQSPLKSKRNKAKSDEDLILFLDYLKKKNKELFLSIMAKSNQESNDNEGYIVVYCDTGHKNIVYT